MQESRHAPWQASELRVPRDTVPSVERVIGLRKAIAKQQSDSAARPILGGDRPVRVM
jgi:hypothetical protein